MAKNTSRPEIDSLAGRCGLCFTCSYECTTNNVHC